MNKFSKFRIIAALLVATLFLLDYKYIGKGELSPISNTLLMLIFIVFIFIDLNKKQKSK